MQEIWQTVPYCTTVARRKFNATPSAISERNFETGVPGEVCDETQRSVRVVSSFSLIHHIFPLFLLYFARATATAQQLHVGNLTQLRAIFSSHWCCNAKDKRARFVRCKWNFYVGGHEKSSITHRRINGEREKTNANGLNLEKGQHRSVANESGTS